MSGGAADADSDDEFVRRFEDSALASLSHEDHVRLAWRYLSERPLARVLQELPSKLRSFAAAKGCPDRYHETVTYAFIVLIHERLHAADGGTWAQFRRNNADLFERDFLFQFYERDTLRSAVARRVFVLPRPSRASTRPPIESHEL